jgi:hypothetical protein
MKKVGSSGFPPFSIEGQANAPGSVCQRHAYPHAAKICAHSRSIRDLWENILIKDK